MNKLAVILIRGHVGLSDSIKDTLVCLRLQRKFVCVIVNDTPEVRGRLQHVKDYVTYGTVDEKLFKMLLEKRGKKKGDKPLTAEEVTKVIGLFNKDKYDVKEVMAMDIKPYFRLHPPIKGFERAGIKRAFAQGGALGNRKEAIGALIERML